MTQTHKDKYGQAGKLKAKAGKAEELSAILLEASRLVAEVKGCIFYVVGKDMLDPDSIWITEVWECKEDHDNSLKIPAVRELITKAMPLIAGSVEKGAEFAVLGGKGIDC